MKKYQKLARPTDRKAQGILKDGDNIVIQEKLDGANASFRREGDELVCFSRKQQLDEHNTLNGFYNWVKSLDPMQFPKGYTHFGEWLCRSRIDYGKYKKQFFLFDVYDEAQEMYGGWPLVKLVAEKQGLNLVPCFYQGVYQGDEHMRSYVGMSFLAIRGEGVVVKHRFPETRPETRNFIKIVSDEYKEMKTPKQTKKAPLESQFVEQFLTRARVEKKLDELVDEQIIPEHFDITDMGMILPNLKPRILEDILEEEYDSLRKVVNRSIGKQLPKHVKEVIGE